MKIISIISMMLLWASTTNSFSNSFDDVRIVLEKSKHFQKTMGYFASDVKIESIKIVENSNNLELAIEDFYKNHEIQKFHQIIGWNMSSLFELLFVDYKKDPFNGNLHPIDEAYKLTFDLISETKKSQKRTYHFLSHKSNHIPGQDSFTLFLGTILNDSENREFVVEFSATAPFRAVSIGKSIRGSSSSLEIEYLLNKKFTCSDFKSDQDVCEIAKLLFSSSTK